MLEAESGHPGNCRNNEDFLTGGTGFIGSYLLKELLQVGHDVIAIRRPGSLPVIPPAAANMVGVFFV